MTPTRRVVALVTGVLIIASCASSGRAGVRVDSVQANIVFGVKEPEPGQIATPTGVAYTSSGQQAQPLRVPGLNRVDEIPTSSLVSDCPNAPIGSAPEAAAADNATQPPAPGLYRYKIEGVTKLTLATGTSFDVPVRAFEPHLVRNVTKTSDTFWTYEVAQPSDTGGTDVTTWSVNTKAVQRTANGIVVKGVTVGEPARGIAISKIVQYDGNGNTVGSFQSTPGLLQLPLPVVSGADFQGVGVDSKSGQTEQVTGRVKARQAVDACGTLVDGWLAHLDIKQTGEGATVTQSEDDVFSNELGGLLISKHVVFDAVDSAGNQRHVDVTVSLGQTTPTDFPAGNT